MHALNFGAEWKIVKWPPWNKMDDFFQNSGIFLVIRLNNTKKSWIHSGQKCFIQVTCLWSKMPMLQRAGMRKGGEPLPLAFQHLILMIWRPCYLNLAMISSLASKCQGFKVEMLFFQPLCVMKLKTSKFKVLAFWSQWRYHYQIQITRSSYHKNQMLKY